MEFVALSDTVDRLGAQISLEGALRHVANKTFRDRVSGRKDLVRAESDLRQCELRMALIDERMESSDPRAPGYASAKIKAYSLQKKLIEAYQRTDSPYEAMVNALKDMQAIRSEKKL
jgi:hypothetical protein